MHKIAALALPDVIAFDLAIVGQVFDHVDMADHYQFLACAPQPGAVPSTTGYSVLVDAGLDALASADTVVVPAYISARRPEPVVIDALVEAYDRGARVMSICTGAFALAAAGLLDGRRATTHWQDSERLASQHPLVSVDADVLYVDDGQLLTSAGGAAGIDLCLHVVRNDIGAEAATRVARRLVVAPHRDGGQAQFLDRPVPAAGRGLADTCAWATARLSEPITVADLARHAGWSPRTFARRFLADTGTTPLKWLAAQRLHHARRLLEMTDLPIDRVAAESGLGSGANLRQQFAREVGTNPSAYRRTFQGKASCAEPRLRSA